MTSAQLAPAGVLSVSLRTCPIPMVTVRYPALSHRWRAAELAEREGPPSSGKRSRAPISEILRSTTYEAI